MSVTYILCLAQIVCVCHRQSVAVTDIFCVTDSLCLSQIVCVCHRQSLYVSLCIRQTPFLIILGLVFTYLYMIFIVCHKQLLSVTENLCLSQKVCVRHRQSVSVTNVFVPHRYSVYVTDNLCLSQTVCICHRLREYVFVT